MSIPKEFFGSTFKTSVAGFICTPPRRGPDGKALLRKPFFKDPSIFAKQYIGCGTDILFNQKIRRNACTRLCLKLRDYVDFWKEITILG